MHSDGEELDFSNGSPASEYVHLRNKGNFRKAVAVSAFISLLAMIIGFGSNREYWWLKITGHSINAIVVDVEQDVVGFWVSRFGRLPMIDTIYTFEYQDHHGFDRQGKYRIQDGVIRYNPGDTLPIMYSRFSDDDSGRPSDWYFYRNNDRSWLPLTLIGLGGLCSLITSAGIWLKVRTGAPMRQPVSKNHPD